MELGALLVLLGVVLAIVALFVPVHSAKLLAAAIALVGVGVLLGVGEPLIETNA